MSRHIHAVRMIAEVAQWTAALPLSSSKDTVVVSLSSIKDAVVVSLSKISSSEPYVGQNKKKLIL